MQGVSGNVHVDAPLFCAAWRFRSFFSSQWQVEIIQSARDVDIPLAIKLARRAQRTQRRFFNSSRTVVVLYGLNAMKWKLFPHLPAAAIRQ